jgi:site-specific DNA-methyltransferase (adenine-specific)
MPRPKRLKPRVLLHGGDCLDVLRTLDANSIDACVTDPPYHLTNHGTLGLRTSPPRTFRHKPVS